MCAANFYKFDSYQDDCTGCGHRPVSRPILIKLLEEEKIPYHKVGKHSRVQFEDVMHYKRTIDQERETILDQLVGDAQEWHIGYDQR